MRFQSLMRLGPFAALSIAILSTPAASQDMISITWGGSVYKVDSTTGVSSFVGSSGYSSTNSLARSSAGDFYTVSGSSLVQIDPNTGAGSLVAVTSLASVRGLAFGAGDVLYAIEDSTGGVSQDDLYRVDIATGAASFIGSTGYFGIQALAYNAGRLYAWECGSGGGFGDGLITIDPATGAATDVNVAVGGSCGEVQGLTFDASGNLFGSKETLYKIDTATGVIAPIGFTGADIRGIDFLSGGCSSPTLAVSNLVAGSIATASVTCATPSGTVIVAYSLAGAGPTLVNAGACGIVSVDLSLPIVQLPAATADPSGNASISAGVPAGTTGLNVWVQGFDVGSCSTTNSLALVVG